jgi:hypothetical protein
MSMRKEPLKGWTERIVITDVTKMRGENVCVAGLNRNLECRRPVLQTGALNSALLYKEGDQIIAPRHVLEFFFNGKASNPPHTEDCICVPERTKLIKKLTEEEMKRVLSKSCFDSVDELFENGLIEEKYAKPETGTRSIGTIRAGISNVDLINYRISFYDKAGKSYFSRKVTDLSFIALADELTSRGAGKDAARRLKEQFDHSEVFLRLGLTRPWAKPEGQRGCWLQVTGIYTFPNYCCAAIVPNIERPQAAPEASVSADDRMPLEPKSYSLDQIRKKHPKAYEKWSEEEDRYLLGLFQDGRTIQQLSHEFGRQPSAIQSRLKILLEKESIDSGIFEELRMLRAKIAREQEVPAFVIFHDRVLRELAKEKPVTLEALMKVPGVGPRKCELYGDMVLELLRKHLPG